MSSRNTMPIAADNLDKLRELFPEVFIEGKIDFTKLRLLLGDQIETASERYELTWHGKSKAVQQAQEQATKRLCLAPEKSRYVETTNNLYIEGDNLEVLRLLQQDYREQIKLIYIDPPYNTGQDLIYHDDFRDSITRYLQKTNQSLTPHAERSGRFHTDWLNMMYPRLWLARQLLREDGLICISISDIEEANLRKLCDEILGEENYINTVCVKVKTSAGASGGGEDKRLKKNMEYIHIYAKCLEALPPLTDLYQHVNLLERIRTMRAEGQSWKYTNILIGSGEREKLTTITDGDGNPIEIYLRTGVKRTTIAQVMKAEKLTEEEAYRTYLPSIFADTNAQSSIRTRVIAAVGNLSEATMYEVEYVPRTGKMKGQKVTHHYISNTVRRVIWLRDVAEERGGMLYKKERLSTLWDDIPFNNVGKEGHIRFPHGKKPIELIKRCIQLAGNDSEAIILDFFSGSASTAHAVMELNREDGGARRFIMVQLPEPVNPTSALYQEGFRDICQIGQERIERAGDDIRASTGNTDIDIGFQVFTLA